MNPQTSVIGLNGAAGRIDIAVDRPAQGALLAAFAALSAHRPLEMR
jgi:hypothetical protein